MSERICSIEDCEGSVVARGWCRKHYQRWWKGGDPLVAIPRGGKARKYPPVCSINGCDRPHHSRSWCEMHYLRWRNQGDPLVVKIFRGPLAERIAHRTRRDDETGCLLWIAPPSSMNAYGYGMLSVDGRPRLAHRVSWELANGRKIRPGMFILHECDTPSCVEPTHLREGTHQENMVEMHTRGRRPEHRWVQHDRDQLSLF